MDMLISEAYLPVRILGALQMPIHLHFSSEDWDRIQRDWTAWWQHESDRLTAAITQLWLRCYDELFQIIQTAGLGTTSWAPMWCLGGYYML